MKKGCFIKIIIVVTIVVAAIVYIIENHFDDWVVGPGKKIISGFVSDELGDKLTYLPDTPEKDSLKIILENYINYTMETKKKINNREIGSVAKEISKALNDSVLTWDDVSRIKNHIDSVKAL